MGWRLGGDVDLFRRNYNGELECILTTRPCPECGWPLAEGPVAYVGEVEVHAACRTPRIFVPHFYIAEAKQGD